MTGLGRRRRGRRPYSKNFSIFSSVMGRFPKRTLLPPLPPLGLQPDGTANTERRYIVDLTAARRIADAMDRVEQTLKRHYPHLLPALKATLAVVATGCLSRSSRPLTLMLMGPPSVGKSLLLSFLMHDGRGDDPLNTFVKRCDQMSPAAFKNHLRTRRHQTIVFNKLDLFLSPWKRADISTLGAWLSGAPCSELAQGEQPGTPVFQWLGEVDSDQLFEKQFTRKFGPVLDSALFFEVARPEQDVGDLLERLQDDPQARQAECRTVVRSLLADVFTTYSLGGVSNAAVEIDRRCMQQLRASADELKKHPRFSAQIGANQEAALQCLARGSALVHGRAHVNDFDLTQVAHVVRSSIDPSGVRVA